MEERRVTVRETTRKHSDKAKKDYLVVEDTNGKKYSLWGNHELWDTIQPGFILKLTGEVKGDFFNVSSFSLDLPDTTPKATPDYPGYKPEDKMGKNDWAEKDRVTRESIERQTALKAAVELAVVDSIPVEDVTVLADVFLEWLKTGVLKPATVKSTATAVKPTAQKTDTPAQNIEMKNLGDLFKACKDNYKMTIADVCKELGVSEKESIPDVVDAWETIKAAKG